jgi:hypothetical protein
MRISACCLCHSFRLSTVEILQGLVCHPSQVSFRRLAARWLAVDVALRPLLHPCKILLAREPDIDSGLSYPSRHRLPRYSGDHRALSRCGEGSGSVHADYPVPQRMTLPCHTFQYVECFVSRQRTAPLTLSTIRESPQKPTKPQQIRPFRQGALRAFAPERITLARPALRAFRSF